jgi:hypothetical protein
LWLNQYSCFRLKASTDLEASNQALLVLEIPIEYRPQCKPSPTGLSRNRQAFVLSCQAIQNGLPLSNCEV